MEFSILIPVYNSNIQGLAEELSRQALALTPNFQILFIDDCSDLSTSYINQKVKALDKVEYEVLTTNIGRSAIRNLLFSKATFEKCIILDGDVSIIKTDFIKTYLSVLNADNVIVGGHVYQKNPPKVASKYLHWLYGSKIESKPASERQLHPYHSFMTSNFACSKSIFQQINFDESIKGYGHEDTLFGQELERLNIPILHIQNPVRHDGMDELTHFLNKQQEAVKNLKFLYDTKRLARNSKLIRFAKYNWVGFMFSLFRKRIDKNLHSAKPSLFALQAQKVLWWRALN